MIKKILSLFALVFAASTFAGPLSVPAGYPALLGASCGGVQVKWYITGFDSVGNVMGEAYATTSCSTGGRGSRPHRYVAYHSITWDFFGGYVVRAYDGGALNQTFVAVDSYGNMASIVAGAPTLTVSMVPTNATHVSGTVPAVVGSTAAIASATVSAVGLVPVVYYQYSPYLKGAVIAVNPISGAVLPLGSTVSITVSLGFCDGVNVNCD